MAGDGDKVKWWYVGVPLLYVPYIRVFLREQNLMANWWHELNCYQLAFQLINSATMWWSQQRCDDHNNDVDHDILQWLKVSSLRLLFRAISGCVECWCLVLSCACVDVERQCIEKQSKHRGKPVLYKLALHRGKSVHYKLALHRGMPVHYKLALYRGMPVHTVTLRFSEVTVTEIGPSLRTSRRLIKWPVI